MRTVTAGPQQPGKPLRVVTRRELTSEESSVPEARKLARDACAAWGVDPEKTYDVGLVMTELVTNAINAARKTLDHPDSEPPRRIAFGVERETAGVMCWAWDPSRERPIFQDPDYVAEPGKNPMTASGRGLHVMQQLCTAGRPEMHPKWFHIDWSSGYGKIVSVVVPVQWNV
jgi:anti-sigma regulatory factor (Ser/Thr protein kinase)